MMANLLGGALTDGAAFAGDDDCWLGECTFVNRSSPFYTLNDALQGSVLAVDEKLPANVGVERGPSYLV